MNTRDMLDLFPDEAEVRHHALIMRYFDDDRESPLLFPDAERKERSAYTEMTVGEGTDSVTIDFADLPDSE